MTTKISQSAITSNLISVVKEQDESCDIEVLRTWPEAEVLQKDWDRFVKSLDGPMFSGYVWCRIWWNIYG